MDFASRVGSSQSQSATVKVGLTNLTDLQQWDQFVICHPYGMIYHLSRWKRVLETSFKHISGEVFVLKSPDSSKIIAGLPVYTVRSWILGNRYISIPFASASDLLVSSEDQTRVFLQSILERAVTSRISTIEIKALNTGSMLLSNGLECANKHKYHFLTLDGNSERVYQGISKRQRRMISKAEKSGIAVRQATGLQDLRLFYELLLSSRRRLALPPIPLKFFESLWDNFNGKHLDLTFAVLEGKNIASFLALKFKDSFSFEFSGETQAARNTGANQLLIWTAIRQAIHDNYRCFSFGRTSVENKGLLDFKRQWGTTEVDNPILRSAAQGNGNAFRSILERNYGLRSLIRFVPDSVYRLLGRLWYQHWG